MTENRLGKQPLKSLLLTMCTQTTFSLILYSMYGLTDAFYVSRGVGGYASAAVGVFSPVTVLIGGDHHHGRHRDRLCPFKKIGSKRTGKSCGCRWLHVLSLDRLRRTDHLCGFKPV